MLRTCRREPQARGFARSANPHSLSPDYTEVARKIHCALALRRLGRREYRPSYNVFRIAATALAVVRLSSGWKYVQPAMRCSSDRTATGSFAARILSSHNPRSVSPSSQTRVVLFAPAAERSRPLVYLTFVIFLNTRLDLAQNHYLQTHQN